MICPGVRRIAEQDALVLELAFVGDHLHRSLRVGWPAGHLDELRTLV